MLGSRNPDLLRQLGEVFDDAGVLCERSPDVTGIELAGVAKNISTLAASIAEPYGLNAAGAAAALVWRECATFARARGAREETFAGLAGMGDLTATIMAPGSRNRRAGGLLAQGLSADAIEPVIGQAAESLDCLPLMARIIAESGGRNKALIALTDVVEGRLAPEEWVARLRRPEGIRRAA